MAIRYPKEITVLQIIVEDRSYAKGNLSAVQQTFNCVGHEFWIPARSLPYVPWLLPALRHRLRCAWIVFTGRADVLYWK